MRKVLKCRFFSFHFVSDVILICVVCFLFLGRLYFSCCYIFHGKTDYTHEHWLKWTYIYMYPRTHTHTHQHAHMKFEIKWKRKPKPTKSITIHSIETGRDWKCEKKTNAGTNRFITLFPQIGNQVDLRTLRAIRVLRPLKLVSGIPSE